MNFLFFFFFQAEDGIRDGTVTGVQTCALPICIGRAAGDAVLKAARQLRGESHLEGRVELARACQELVEQPELVVTELRRAGLDHIRDCRSEERRVGKECRSRGWTDQ